MRLDGHLSASPPPRLKAVAARPRARLREPAEGVVGGPSVLVIDADPVVAAALADHLAAEGLRACAETPASEALDDARLTGADALVIGAPATSAAVRDLCASLRSRGIDTPMLLLTARGELSERLAGFAAGADDCLEMPAAVAELAARLRALARRAARSASPSERVRLDEAAHVMRTHAGPVALTPIEFRLVARLAVAPGEVVRRADLVREAWPAGALVNDNSLDAHVARLRRKLAAAAGAPAIVTVHRVGYRLG